MIWFLLYIVFKTFFNFNWIFYTFH
jgi:hypothetical protein